MKNWVGILRKNYIIILTDYWDNRILNNPEYEVILALACVRTSSRVSTRRKRQRIDASATSRIMILGFSIDPSSCTALAGSRQNQDFNSEYRVILLSSSLERKETNSRDKCPRRRALGEMAASAPNRLVRLLRSFREEGFFRAPAGAININPNPGPVRPGDRTRRDRKVIRHNISQFPGSYGAFTSRVLTNYYGWWRPRIYNRRPRDCQPANN